MALATFTVGGQRRAYQPTIVDENGNPINLTGGYGRLQGRSRDLPSITIDFLGTLVDAAGGVVKFASMGGLVTQANLTAAAVDRATFRCKVKYQDNTGLVDFTDEFEFIWSEDPLQPA